LRYGESQVLLAMPSATRSRRRQILVDLQPLAVKVRTVPDIADILAGNAHVEDIRDVDAGDLLGRDQVAPVQHLFDACIRGKSVMVTGAGGSIGSELCRQIVRLGPARIVLLEMSELALYNIDRELRTSSARSRSPSNWCRCWATRITAIACRRSCRAIRSRRSTTRRPTSTCRWWSTTSSRASTTT
jgi:FlaA1/EpsC-like NDP-sugar epimerase